MSARDATSGPWSRPEAAAPRQSTAPSRPLPGGTGLPPAPPGKLVFTGEAKEFFRLCLRAGVFTVLTLGLYRFWFLTDVRRVLWRHTRVGRDSFEYRGTGRELLLGFLFALAILAPLYLVYFLIGVEAERYKAFSSLPFFLILALFGIYASYRARRYRLTRTVFRGARFWMTGSGFNYLARYVGWVLLALLTLGLAYPWMVASLERYKMGNTFYGDLRGSFEGRGGAFFKRGILLWVLAMLLLAAFVVLLVAIVGVRTHRDISSEEAAAAFASALAVLFVLSLLSILSLMKGIEWRWWSEGLRFGQAHLVSALGVWFLFKEYFKYTLAVLGAMLLWLIAVAIVMGGASAAFGPLEDPHLTSFGALLHLTSSQYFLGVVVIAAYLCLFVVMSALYRRFLVFGVWRKVIDSLTLHGGEVFDNVTVTGTPSSAVGEALADALDFGF